MAKNLARRNPDINQRELNFSVMRIIDRIIFLRMCEDRGIEAYGQLQALVNGSQVYPRLCQLFRKADDRYNSGLFHFKEEKDRPTPPDHLTLDLAVDDKILKDILKCLYYPQSPYEFSVLPTEILGQVYEQFLGKVIRLTKGHQARVEEKPEVKKAGGVYYTPTYIVDYIVKHTVGKLLEGKKPGTKTLDKIKILDPACGSGSFLLGAYQFLIDWYRDEYVKAGPDKHKKVLYETSGGEWRLTTDEKKRVLLTHIYGVDIDPQAVETTKLSLLLKVLEGEDGEVLRRQMQLFQQRALPDLGHNIKCGNSLIGPDFYDQQQMNLLDDDDHYRINVFDWNTEFADIMQSGGFDAVIGNPPWGALFSSEELNYHRMRNQEIIVRMIDSFMYFVHQGCKKLSSNGKFGMILPDVILYQKDNFKLRGLILKEFRINIVLNMGDVFSKVNRPAAILIFEKNKQSNYSLNVGNLSRYKKHEKPEILKNEFSLFSLSKKDIDKIPEKIFVTDDPRKYAIWEKIQCLSVKALKEFVDEDGIQRGVSPDLKKAFLVDSQTVADNNLEESHLKRTLTGGKQVKRYWINDVDLWLIYTGRSDDFSLLPNICKYIDQFKREISCKEVEKNKHPIYALHRPRKPDIFLKDKKILGVITGDRIIATLDGSKKFVTDGLFLLSSKVGINEKYLIGILNSNFFVFIYRLLSNEKGRVLSQVKPTVVSKLPIRTIDFSNEEDKIRHDKMVELVERMLDLNKKLAVTKTNHEQAMLKRQIDATDRQIDQLVYQLYDLTPEEIAIVEGNNK